MFSDHSICKDLLPLIDTHARCAMRLKTVQKAGRAGNNEPDEWRQAREQELVARARLLAWDPSSEHCAACRMRYLFAAVLAAQLCFDTSTLQMIAKVSTQRGNPQISDG